MTSTNLSNKEKYSAIAIKKGVYTWETLLQHVKHLPYGRNRNREDFSLVLKEGRGSCSSKHALLKLIADENNFKNVKLMLTIYKMNEINTPGIGKSLAEHDLAFIPEAHCFLKINSEGHDFTSANSNLSVLKQDILIEKEIKPHQVVDYKVEYHRTYLKEWLDDNRMKLSLDQLWEIREKCIENLSLV